MLGRIGQSRSPFMCFVFQRSSYDHQQTKPAGAKLYRHQQAVGGAYGTRTRNPLLAKQVRYQLRQGPLEVNRVSHLLPRRLALHVLLDLEEDDVTSQASQTHQSEPLHRDLPQLTSGRTWTRTTDLHIISVAL